MIHFSLHSRSSILHDHLKLFQYFTFNLPTAFVVIIFSSVIACVDVLFRLIKKVCGASLLPLTLFSRMSTRLWGFRTDWEPKLMCTRKLPTGCKPAARSDWLNSTTKNQNKSANPTTRQALIRFVIFSRTSALLGSGPRVHKTQSGLFVRCDSLRVICIWGVSCQQY